MLHGCSIPYYSSGACIVCVVYKQVILRDVKQFYGS